MINLQNILSGVRPPDVMQNNLNGISPELLDRMLRSLVPNKTSIGDAISNQGPEFIPIAEQGPTVETNPIAEPLPTKEIVPVSDYRFRLRPSPIAEQRSNVITEPYGDAPWNTSGVLKSAPTAKGGEITEIKRRKTSAEYGPSWDIIQDGKRIGWIGGYEGVDKFNLRQTEISDIANRGKGSYQKAIQQVANLYPEGLISKDFQMSTPLRKALMKMPNAIVDKEGNITIPPLSKLSPKEGGEIEVKYAKIEDLNDFNKELAKLKESGILSQDNMVAPKGKGNELAKRTLSVFGGNDLTPQANRSLKEMKFILEDSPDLIRLVPEKDIDIVMEYMKQNAGVIHPKLVDILNESKLSTPTGE